MDHGSESGNVQPWYLCWAMYLQVGYFGLCYKTKKGYDWWIVLEKSIKKQLEQNTLSSVGSIRLKLKIHFFVTGSSWLKLQGKLIR